jgi:hypothetical protein
MRNTIIGAKKKMLYPDFAPACSPISFAQTRWGQFELTEITMRKLFILSACVFACVTVATGTVVFTTLSSVERTVDPAAVAASLPGSRY